MRTLRKNKQALKYSLQAALVPAFETDEDGNIMFATYTDEDGNEYPILDDDGNKVPLFQEYGDLEVLYGEPVPFYGNIALSGGEAESVEYGLSVESYEAVVITESNAVPLTEGTIIWFQSEPEYISEDPIHITVNDKEISGRFARKTSADFIVLKKSPSLNYDKYILGAVNK